MVYHCQDLGISTSNWLRQISLVARPIRSTTQIRVVTCHQYGISPFNHPRDLKSGVPGGQSTRKPGLTLQNVGCFLRLPVLGNSLWIRPKPSKFTMYLKSSFLLWLVSHTCISAVDIRSLSYDSFLLQRCTLCWWQHVQHLHAFQKNRFSSVLNCCYRRMPESMFTISKLF